jgi:hypothetical protein
VYATSCPGPAREGLDHAGQTRPDHYHSIAPYLIVDGAARPIAFGMAVFGAQETMRLADTQATRPVRVR